MVRAPMRSRVVHAAPGAGADYGLARGVVGVGEALPAPPATAAEAILALSAAHGERAGRRLARFIDLPDGTYVWTRSSDESFRLGRITGGWRYDDGAQARAVGVHHVRPVEWLPRRFSAAEAPLGVARTFARGGRNLQRIHDPSVGPETVARWEGAAPAT